MRGARYSRAVQAGLAVSFCVGAAWGTASLLRAPPSPVDVTLDIGELRARAAELVVLFDARSRDALTQPFARAQHGQWARAVRSVNEHLVDAAADDRDATRAHEAAVELLRIGESLPSAATDPAARDAAARIAASLLATERARKGAERP